jgi:hypothetical protein
MSKVEKIKAKIEKEDGEYIAFYQSVIQLGVADLKKDILRYTKYLQETMHALATKSEIKEAKEALKLAKKPFTDAIKASEDKVKQLKGFVDDSICVEDLEGQMIINAMEIEEQKIRMDVSVSVQDAKDELEMVKGPFTDAKTGFELKISYLNILISEAQGFEPGYRDEE